MRNKGPVCFHLDLYYTKVPATIWEIIDVLRALCAKQT